MSQDDEGVTLTVQGAEKRDAGRGIARIPESARRKIGVISGDTVVIEGKKTTVAKYWPGGSDMPDGIIRIDADTRANAGVSIGDEVQVSQKQVRAAQTVTVAYPDSVDVDQSLIQKTVTHDLRDRPVSEGEQVHLERITDEPFVVTSTAPEGPVIITEKTTVLTDPASYDRDDVPEKSGSKEDEASSSGSARVTYEDIGGLDEELEQVREMIELPLKEPGLFQRLGIEPPKGLLMHGPPGTGKTLIAKAVANEVDAEFISVKGPEIMSKYKGESEEHIRDIFEHATESSPAIIFFDEIDAIAGERDSESDVENRIVAQLLSLMDGLDPRNDVIVIGATNRVDTIDPALRRGGRFDREIEIGVPDEKGRKEIFEVQARNMPLADDVSLDNLASRTHGFVGADIHALVTEAAMEALPRFQKAGDDEDPRITRADFEAAMANVEPSAMREFVAETPEASFEDVGGLADAKQALRESVEWPLVYGKLFEATNTHPPAGILLYGPPGTGKTLLGRALAGESEVNFIHVAGPELIDKYVGESEKAVREVFERARAAAPSIVFFDEIDAIARDRGQDSHEVTQRVVSQLLTELDGMAENYNVVVLAATNRKHVLDEAILRPGRFDTHVEVPAPDVEARRKIFEVHTRGKPLGEDVDLEELADRMNGYTGADIEAVVQAASMRAIRQVADKYGPEEANDHADEVVIAKEHFESALEGVEPTLG